MFNLNLYYKDTKLLYYVYRLEKFAVKQILKWNVANG